MVQERHVQLMGLSARQFADIIVITENLEMEFIPLTARTYTHIGDYFTTITNPHFFILILISLKNVIWHNA